MNWEKHYASIDEDIKINKAIQKELGISDEEVEASPMFNQAIQKYIEKLK